MAKDSLVEVTKGDKTVKVTIPSDMLGEVDKDGNATIKDEKAFGVLVDKAIKFHEDRQAARTAKRPHEQNRESTPEELYPRKLPDFIAPHQYPNPNDPTPTWERGLGYAEDAANVGAMVAAPLGVGGIARSLAAAPIKTGANILAGTAGAYGGKKLGEAAGLDPEISDLTGAAGGFATQSPKITSAIGAGIGRMFDPGNLLKTGFAGMLGGGIAPMFEINPKTGAELGAAISNIKPAVEAGYEASKGKDWLGPALKSMGKDNTPNAEEEFNWESYRSSQKSNSSPPPKSPPKPHTNKPPEILEPKLLEAGPSEAAASEVKPEAATSERPIITKSAVEQHANDNGISVEDAEKNFKDHSVLNRTQMNRALHGMGTKKGLSHQDLSDIGNQLYKTDSLSKLTDQQLHEIHKAVEQLPDIAKTTVKSKAGGYVPKTSEDLTKDLEDSIKNIKKTP